MSCEQDNVAETLCKLMKIVPILPIWTSPWRNRLVRSAVSERLVDQSQPGTVLFALMSKLLLISLIILSDNQYWPQRHVSSTLFFFSLPEIKDLRKKAAIFFWYKFSSVCQHNRIWSREAKFIEDEILRLSSLKNIVKICQNVITNDKKGAKQVRQIMFQCRGSRKAYKDHHPLLVS